MIFGGSFQPQLFYNSLKSDQQLYHSKQEEQLALKKQCNFFCSVLLLEEKMYHK